MPREGAVFKQPFHLYCTDPRDGVGNLEAVDGQDVTRLLVVQATVVDEP